MIAYVISWPEGETAGDGIECEFKQRSGYFIHSIPVKKGKYDTYKSGVSLKKQYIYRKLKYELLIPVVGRKRKN